MPEKQFQNSNEKNGDKKKHGKMNDMEIWGSEKERGGKR